MSFPAAARPPVLLAALVAAALLPAACSRDGGAGKLNLPREVAKDPAADPALRVVTAVAPLRKDPAGATLALLQRGERVTFLEARDEQSRVRTSGGQEGWLRAASLVPASAVQEATVVVASLAFDRPDLLAVNAKRKVEPGTLLLVRASKDLFSEVDAGPGPATWVLTDRLSMQPADVAAARLVEKARWLRKQDRGAEAREVLALLRSTLPGSPFIPALAVELGEAPPAGTDGAAAPSGPSAPSGPAAGTGSQP